MTDDLDRSRLDGVVDDVVRQMMNVDARSDLASRVVGAGLEPVRRPWFVLAPAVATAAVVLVLVGLGSLGSFRAADPVPVPALAVASGPPTGLEPTHPAPAIELAPAERSGPGTSPRRSGRSAQPSAESIFGTRSGRVGAASVRPAPQVRVILSVTRTRGDGTTRGEDLTLLLPPEVTRETRAGDGEHEFRAAGRSEVLPDGRIRATFQISAPLERELSITLVPGTRTRMLEADTPSGGRVVIDVTAAIMRAAQR